MAQRLVCAMRKNKRLKGYSMINHTKALHNWYLSRDKWKNVKPEHEKVQSNPKKKLQSTSVNDFWPASPVDD